MPGILRIKDLAFEVDHDRSQFFAYVPQEPPGQPSSRWDEEYSTRLPLQLNTEIVFNGVHTWWLKADAKGQVEARELIGRHFDLTGLEGPQTDSPYHIVFPPKVLK